MDETVEISKRDLQELRFYGFAGISIIRFQQIEDHLEAPFAKLLGIPAERSGMVFGAIRTIASRCKVISGLIEAERPELTDEWKDLTRRILQAENSRNSIAHGSPVFGGGGARFHFDQTNASLTLLSKTESFFHLKKRGFNDWTTERLLDEARRNEALLSDLYSFDRLLDQPRA